MFFFFYNHLFPSQVRVQAAHGEKVESMCRPSGGDGELLAGVALDYYACPLGMIKLY